MLQPTPARFWPRAAALFLFLTAPGLAQGSLADYARSEGLREAYSGKLRRFRPQLRWTEAADAVWWKEGKSYVRVDCSTGERRSDEDPAVLGLAGTSGLLEPRNGWSRSRGGGEATRITFQNTFDRPVRLFWAMTSGGLRAYGEIGAGESYELGTYTGHVWVLDFAKDDLAGIFVAEAWDGTCVLDEASRAAAMSPIRQGGGPENPAKDPLESPDGRWALSFHETAVEVRTIPLVDSAPDDRVQPRLETLRYAKPGDDLPQRQPRLFDRQERRMIPIDASLFRDSWSVDFEHWSPDSDRVYVCYHERGHQRIAIRAIDVATGAVTDVIDERSDTFIDYSQKQWIHWLDDTNEILWASERDGWNHLYRIDAATGQVKGQITSGKWVVRGVERVDEAAGQIWFTAMGIHPDQDPYHKHLARVDFDGKNLTVLTSGDGTHRWTMSPDGQTFIDRWSRVDLPERTDLRSATDGRKIAELGRDDASALEAAGYRAPERFSAPGRDGTVHTWAQIWGHIIRPSNFDPERSYPVIEAIYAGPHGHHVPKAFGLQTSLRRLAELGFVVVQIDGMGTNWRSKAFHDVAWQNLKDGGFPDRIAWLRAVAEKEPAMDLTRVGIYGGSAGGQNALAALLHHGDFYDAAAADCGCHDNRMDKIWWNEAWMGRMGPHYAENSNVTHAHRLQGDLLLTVGELDRNVDPASTLQVVDALIRADKDFEFVLVPGAGHGVGESPYLFRRRMDFFVRSLWKRTPRAE